jgi:uncharacterized membrane protein
MANIEKSIEVNLPVRTAYNQWTQFEEFPQFMEGVEEVRQLDDKRLHWRASIAGKTEEWHAEIVEQTPDMVVAWRSTTGAENAGRVSFAPAGMNATRVTLRLDYDPEGIVESAGDKLGFVSRRVEGDLERFKEFIESRGAETGAWRGEIHGGTVESGASSTG